MAIHQAPNTRPETERPAPTPRKWEQITGLNPTHIRAQATTQPPSWRQLSLRAAAQIPQTYARQTQPRLRRLTHHFAQAGQDLNTWVARFPTLTNAKAIRAFLQDTLVGPLAWLGRLATQVLDLCGLAEIWDFFGQLIKPNTRALTAQEIAEGRKVYGDAITWSKVRIDERSAIATIGKWLQRAPAMGVVVGHTIHFSRKIAPRPGNSEMAWLIHEFMHVLQCEAAGLQYIGEAIHAQYAEGYTYGGTAGLRARTFRAFNREQQGDIARDYYLRVLYQGADPAPYLPHLQAIRQGRI